MMSNAFFLFFPAKWVWVWVHKAVLDLQSPSWWWGWGGEDIFPYSFAYFMIMFWWPPPPEPELKENIWPTYLVLCLTTEHTFTFYLLVLTLITHSPNSCWWWWWSFSRWWCIRLPFSELVQQQQFLLLVSAGNLGWVCAFSPNCHLRWMFSAVVVFVTFFWKLRLVVLSSSIR